MLGTHDVLFMLKAILRNALYGIDCQVTIEASP